MLEKWHEFLAELKKFGKNAALKDLFKIVENELLGVLPTKSLYMGYDWLFFTSEDGNTCLRYDTRTNQIQTQRRRYLENDVEEIERVAYSIGMFRDMRVQREIVVNQFTKVDDGYQLLFESRDIVERFNDRGFQKEATIKAVYCPRFIFVEPELKNRYDLLMPSGMSKNGREGMLNNIEFQEVQTRLHISGLNYTLKVSPNEVSGLVAFHYGNQGTKTCFPLFFGADKTIMYKQFINNPLLQIPCGTPSGFDDDEITFENHDLDACRKYLEGRYSLAKRVMANEYDTSLDKSLIGVQKLEYKN